MNDFSVGDKVEIIDPFKQNNRYYKVGEVGEVYGQYNCYLDVKIDGIIVVGMFKSRYKLVNKPTIPLLDDSLFTID